MTEEKRAVCADMQEKPTVVQLLNGFHHVFWQCMRSRAERSGLSSSYPPFLRTLSHRDGCTQRELAKATHLRAPTVSVTLQRMEQDGIVRRETDKNDARQTLVWLTEKGRDLNTQTIAQIKDLESRALEGLTEEDLGHLERILQIMFNNITQNSGGNQRDEENP